MIEDLSNEGLPIHKATPRIRCKTFEDKMNYIRLATNYKTRPKQSIYLFVFIISGLILFEKLIPIEFINTKQQIADILTKPLPQKQLSVLYTKLIPGHNFVEIATCPT